MGVYNQLLLQTMNCLVKRKLNKKLRCHLETASLTCFTVEMFVSMTPQMSAKCTSKLQNKLTATTAMATTFSFR